MKIAITGGTGFVGSHLAASLVRQGANVLIISRSGNASGDPRGITRITWEQLDDSVALLEGTHGIVNLAGESINQRWTRAAKERILHSRLQAASRIRQYVQRLQIKPRVVLNASGMSVYGTSEFETFDENSPARPADFLSSVVMEWEKEADRIPVERLVKIRVGLVLGSDGGAFPLMALPFKLGLGGRVGSGRQWLSWIHIRDMVRLLEFCLYHPEIGGPVNATAPNPVTNSEFSRILAKVLRRPNWFPVPEFVLKTVLGELSSLLLEGQKVIPRKLMEHGFRFEYPELEPALRQLTGKVSSA